MSLLLGQLGNYKGKRIAVVLVDGTRLKGKLSDYDDETMILEDVTELQGNHWVRPLISRSLGLEIPHPGNEGGKNDHEDYSQKKDQGVLVKVIIRVMHIIRIWPWELKAPPPKEAVESISDV